MAQYDVIVLGTGVMESMIAAALAKAGKTVCHLDRNDYYGGSVVALDLDSLVSTFIKGIDIIHYVAYFGIGYADGTYTDVVFDVKKETIHAESTESREGEEQEVPKEIVTVEHINFSLADGVSDGSHVEASLKEALAPLLKQNRHFCIELSPKLLFSSGNMVKALIRSKVGHYLEFKSIEKVHLLWNKSLEVVRSRLGAPYITNHGEQVPGKKEDVFSSQSISLADKRRLMKFLTEVQEPNFKTVASVLFKEYATGTKLDAKLQAAILYAIAYLDPSNVDTVSTLDGFELVKRYMESLGKYGDTAFLTGIYGTGSELAQAFSRYCAVYGGEYRLSMNIESLTLSDTTLEDYPVKLEGSGSVFYGKHLIASRDYISVVEKDATYSTTTLARAIVVSSRSFFPTLIDFSVIPPSESLSNVVYAVQVNEETHACPKDFYVLHLVCQTESLDVFSKFESIITDLLADTDRSSIALQIMFKQKVKLLPGQSTVFWCSDYTSSIFLEDVPKLSEDVFAKIAPDAIFLPQPAENPDD
ncbi:hypothetical protein HDU97_005550 [Phlyctochytrium planicorne]|nr:hypothetical protein HDU97_005550 [Phlyctochytrium planicorne]